MRNGRNGVGTSRTRATDGAQTLERGLALLDAVARSDAPRSLSDLARAAHLAPSTAHRLLATLSRHRFVEQDAMTRAYRIGARTVALAAFVVQHLDLTREARPVLRQFVAETGEHVSLAALDDGEVVPLDSAGAEGRPRLFLHIGRRAPVHCTALGKALLAWLPEPEVHAMLTRRGMARLTPRTITSPRRLLAHLGEVRRRGYAVDDEETLVGARCVAVPVRNLHGDVVAALSTSGPVSAVTDDRLARMAAALALAAAALSERLGYRGQPTAV